MDRTRFAVTAVAALFLIAGGANAQAAKQSKTDTAPKKLHAQTLCPVMGGEIDSAYYTDIQGQRVYHCCPACAAKLKADPDKYFKKAAEEGVLFQNIQKTCPVSGMAINKEYYTDYVGRRIYFSSADCAAKFAKDPQTYLKKLDQPSDNATADTSASGSK